MIDIEDSAATLADELGPDLPHLQPPDEKHFDPATLAVLVGLWLLHSVASGIADGIKEQTKIGTLSVLQRVGTAIKRRTRRDVEKAMASQSGDEELDQAKETAESAWTEARRALAGESDVDQPEVAETSARGVAEALVEAGLPAASAERVKVVLEAEVRRLLADG